MIKIKKLCYLSILLMFIFFQLSNVIDGVENISIISLEDSFIDISKPDDNFGNGGYLQLLEEYEEIISTGGDSIEYGNKIYLKFDLSSIVTSHVIVEAVLELYLVSSVNNTSKISIHYCSVDSWDENQITWNNAPNYDITSLFNVDDINTEGGWYSFDVTDFVIADGFGIISFVLVGTDTSDILSFYSKDNVFSEDNDYTPRLNIYYSTISDEGNPIANFDFSPFNPLVNDVINFLDKSVDSDGVIISWSWDFGDGSTSNEQNPIHNYPDDGVYDVTLLVTDNDGYNSTITRKISVSILDDDNDSKNNDDVIENGIDSIDSYNGSDKLFGLFSPMELLIIVLILVIIINSAIFIMFLRKRK